MFQGSVLVREFHEMSHLWLHDHAQ